LCGATPAPWKGLWLPTAEASRKLGAPEGRLRVAACGLCSWCRRLPDVLSRMEEMLLAEAAEGLARPEAN
jgi:hypothetical protein